MCCEALVEVQNWHLVIIVSCSSCKSSIFLLVTAVCVKALSTLTAREITVLPSLLVVAGKMVEKCNHLVTV